MSISATAQCGSSQVRISFELKEALTRVTFDPFSSLAELAQLEAPPEASFDRVPDDRPHWEGVGERFPEFTSITDALLGFLGQARASLRQRIVLPVPAERPIAEIEDVALPEIYARLLAYSDGIRINNLNVWGSSGDGQRVFTIDSKRFLYFGGDANHLLALPVLSGVASDAVLRLPARGKPVRTGHDILSLCNSNLNRTSRG